MTKIYLKNFLVCSLILLSSAIAFAQQVPNPGFEDWSGAKFDNKIQPASWFVSNIEQVGIKFNLTHQEAGHSGSYSLMVQDTKVGAMGITETSPGYFSLGKPWSHLEGLDTKTATAGTSGGINFKYRPDTMSVWIKRTGANVTKEDFYLLFYTWNGTAKSSKYKAKNGNCTSVSQTNEESDIRLALDGNECGTDQKANQIAEGMWREKKEYGQWTNIRVPIYYFNNDIPTMMNIIFSASNYPNYRANSGLYEGNSLYVDDVELIYSSKIQKLYIDGKEWKGFDPNSSEEQYYSLGRSATTIPSIKAIRGAGSITNAAGETVAFSGRDLQGSEITITDGVIDGAPVLITIKSEDGKSTSTYKIKFVREASTNAKLKNIFINGKALDKFQPSITDYTHELVYGTQQTPVVTVEQQEDEQTVEITQANSVNGTSIIKVTAADKKTTNTYTIQFGVAKLADNTLKDIKVNGVSVAGFNPNQTLYRVSLPTTTTEIPTVEAISAYAEGEQTIVHTPPTSAANLDGSQHLISVTTPGNATPKTYKLTYKLEASSYSLLKDLQMGENWIPNFAPEQFTYYVNLPIGTTQLPTITYEKGEASQQVTVQEGGLNGVSKVTVLAGNGVDQSEYKIVVATEKSSISTLKMIYIDGQPLDGFNSANTSYNYNLPVGTTQLPNITYDKGDEYQTVNMTLGGVNGITRIAVKAEDGNSTIYQITFSVAKATNATLKMIYLDGKPLEGFDANVFEYNCPLPQGTTKLPVITYDKADEYQNVTTRDGGINGDYKITVRPQSGASQTYTLHFSVATSDNADLKMIYLDGHALEGFDAKVFNYVDTLPMGVLTIPTVTYDKGDESQKVLNVQSNNTQTIKVTAESGRTQTYTIEFIIQRSNSAFLKMIYLDGDSLNNFDKNTFEYTVSLKSPTCPKITVDKEEGQQITITAPYSTGQAKIVVTPESGTPNTYTINFVNISNNFALLKNIYVDGQAIANFSPEVFTYSVVCNSAQPTITYDADSVQVVTEFRQNNIVTLYVIAGSDKAQYEITLLKEANKDCTLRNITIDEVTIEGFDPQTFVYNLPVSAETNMPNIGYEKQYKEQVVYAGMLNANTYSLLVAAQSGDTARYTLHLNKQLSDDANLINLQLQGMETAIDFQPSTYEYTVSLPEGYDLPNILVECKPGQDVALHNLSDQEQQVIVTAPSGKTNIYRIIYNRQKSSNAWLQDILINGTSLDGFDAQVLHYTDTLAWRTKVVPCVQPIGSHPDQTISTYHSQIDGITIIRVVAADGVTAQEYTIHFPVIKSSNTALEFIELDHETVRIDYKANITDYHITLPYGETRVPIVLYQAMEPEQTIQYISRPLGQTSEIIVTAENGKTTSYKLHFAPTYASQPNQLASMSITETGAILDPSNTHQTIALPYGTRTMTVNYTKSFAEQTVWVQPGGIQSPTIITVKSNRPNEEDVIYTLTPQVETQDPAVLTEITINGTPLEGFDSNRFSYIANVESNPIIRYKVNAGATINVTEQNNKHWQAEITYQGRTNIYNIWFYYTTDVLPNTEFSEWEDAKYNGVKPIGWNTLGNIADKYTSVGTYTTGNEVTRDGNDVVKMESKYNAFPLGGFVPAYITLGNISASFSVAAGSDFVVSGGITFRNSPDQMSVRFKSTELSNNKSRIVYQLSGSLMTNVTKEHINTTKQSDFTTVTLDLAETNAKAGIPQSMNIILNSFESESGRNGTEAQKATMYVDWCRFSYNNTLTSLKVNDSVATLDGNTFSFTLPDPENTLVPTLSFNGEVADQAQKVVWSDEVKGEGFGIRTAAITNYAEDGSRKEYTLELKRPLDTKNTLSDLLLNGSTIAAFDANTTEYTVHLSSAIKHLPDVQPIAASSLQTIVTSYADSTMMIVVTPETGEATTYTVRFITDLSDDVQLENIVVEGTEIAFEPTKKEYTVTGEKLPAITFVKKMDGQTVDMNNGILRVTAENGATGIYTILLDKPNISTTGQLSDIEVNGVSLQGFNSDIYEYTLERPESVSFKRVNPTDSVVFIQTPEYMEWQVYGDEQHDYRITYPDHLSSNTLLKAIYIDSVLYDAFNPQVYDYVYATDEPVHIHAVANDEAIQLEVTYDIKGDTTIYSYTVIAEDSTKGNPYRLSIVPNLSKLQYLQSITLDGKQIDNFHPELMEYHIQLPTGAYKASEPTIPTIAYELGAPRQQAYIEHGGLGESTNIIVTAEDGSAQSVYQLHIEAEPSHCVSLTGIAVNGEPIEHFESQRHYYSVKTNQNDVTLTWSSNDNFQTVIQSQDDYSHTLHVIAQDGISSSDYIVEIYQEAASSDVTLANILLDGKPFNLFEQKLNPDLAFSPMQQRYNINLPSGSVNLPEVSALLNCEGQNVEIRTTDQIVEIHVTAPDKVSKNIYTLRFFVPMSSNAHLQMIYLDTDSLDGFVPEHYNYFINLPVGQANMPDIYPIPQESTQTIKDSITGPLQHTIFVTAEDGTVQQYLLAFQRTYSDADTLLAIYGDGAMIDGFQADSFYYAYTLPVGTDHIPELSWQEADEWQTVKTIKQLDTPLKQITLIDVVAGSGKKNTYTVSYEIMLSAVDTLQMIYVGAEQLSGYNPYTSEYFIYLTPGDSVAPNITWIEGDNYQTVTSQNLPHIINGKQVGWKTILQVKAQNGQTRYYTVYCLFEKVLSTNTELMNIYLDGEPMAQFDPAVHMYRITVPLGEKRPFVSAQGAPQQHIEINQADTTIISVLAEDQLTEDTYTIIFIYQQSPYAYLSGIYQDGELIADFRPDSLTYNVLLPYGTTTLPTFTYSTGIDGQKVQIDTIISESNEQLTTCYSFIVTAPDQETSVQYDVFVRVALNDDCSLQSILIDGQLIAGFHPDSTAYQISYPIGTSADKLFKQDAITALANDPNATIQIINDENDFTIVVTAHDGIHTRIYTIEQVILLSNNALLEAIYINDVLLRDFDPNVYEYTYYVSDAQPVVRAVAQDSTALVEYGFYTLGQSYDIYVTAEDGTAVKYSINFIASTIETGAAPQAHDVLMKHIKGTNDLVFATTKKNVSVVVYDAQGYMLFQANVPESSQNDIIMITNANGTEQLIDVFSPLVTFTLPPQNHTIYFYTFYENGKRKIASGKILFYR